MELSILRSFEANISGQPLQDSTGSSGAIFLAGEGGSIISEADGGTRHWVFQCRSRVAQRPVARRCRSPFWSRGFHADSTATRTGRSAIEPCAKPAQTCWRLRMGARSSMYAPLTDRLGAASSRRSPKLRIGPLGAAIRRAWLKCRFYRWRRPASYRARPERRGWRDLALSGDLFCITRSTTWMARNYSAIVHSSATRGRSNLSCQSAKRRRR